MSHFALIDRPAYSSVLWGFPILRSGDCHALLRFISDLGIKNSHFMDPAYRGFFYRVGFTCEGLSVQLVARACATYVTAARHFCPFTKSPLELFPNSCPL